MNSCVEFSLSDFTGYAEAVARESKIRGAACLGLNEVICGLEVKPLTAAHVRLLTTIQTPFLSNYPIAALLEKPNVLDDIMLFFWIISPHYEMGSKASSPKKHWWNRQPKKTARDKFNESFSPIVKQKLDKVIAEILEYVDEAFIDCETHGKEDSKSYYASEISIANEFSAHGFRLDFWNPDCPKERNPLHIPLKIVFQFRKLKRIIEAGKDADVRNKSDECIERGIEAIGLRERNKRETAFHENN